jgi:TonB family protein
LADHGGQVVVNGGAEIDLLEGEGEQAPLPPPEPQPSAVEDQPNGNDLGRKPIEGGVLNSKAISLPTPQYPSIAKAAKVAGTVTVRVTVDETGKVISAQALAGHPLLRAAALAAAHEATFAPTMVGGKPVRVSGIIVYQFALD